MKNTIEELTRENAVHIDVHGPLTTEDVNTINRISDLIENGRGAFPSIGDAVEVFCRDGSYYPNAHIEEIHPNGDATICLSGGFAAVNARGEMSKVSGGPWADVPVNKFVSNGESIKTFQIFRPAAFRPAFSAVCFNAKVRRWKYAEPNPWYGTYSAKDYEIYYHHKYHVKKDGETTGIRHVVGNRIFYSETDYLAWLLTYKGMEFEGGLCGTVFTYRQKEVLIDKDAWDALKLPLDARTINCSVVPIKYRVDDEKHLITEYRYTNQCERGQSWGREYWVARDHMERNKYRHKVLTYVSKP